MKYGLDRSVRLYFSISDISQISGIEHDTLIQWEEAFPLKPTRNRAGKRVYRQVDLHKVQWIQRRLSESAEHADIVQELEMYSPTELKVALESSTEEVFDQVQINTKEEQQQSLKNSVKSAPVNIQSLISEVKSILELLSQLK